MDVDRKNNHFAGVTHLSSDEPEYPDIFMIFETPINATSFTMRITGPNLKFIVSGEFLSKEDAQTKLSDLILPNYIDTEWKILTRDLAVDWKTDIGTHGGASLKLNSGDLPSERVATKPHTWEGFKKYVRALQNNVIVFRGQEDRKWRLRTSFHRRHRANTHRFSFEDVPILYKHLSNLTTHKFNLDIPDELGAFVSLVQHHGYPTPLLDWTYSPFVAAFFAFNDIDGSGELKGRFARIHAFDKGRWTADFPQIHTLREYRPHFSVIETLALNNPRMLPQQALATVTNIADIETYILQCEQKTGNNYLEVFDIPLKERSVVLRELRLMGITSGSLFPGIQGACEQIRSQLFDDF